MLARLLADCGVFAATSAGVVGQVLPAGPCCVQLGGRSSELADSALLLGVLVSEELFGGCSSESAGVVS